MTEQSDLTTGPRLLYPLKAVHTRSRSLAWKARGARAPAGPGFRILYYHRVQALPAGGNPMTQAVAPFSIMMPW